MSPAPTHESGTATRLVDRRTFWPTVLLGVVGAGVAAWAGHHAWIKVAANDLFSRTQGNVDSPAVTALALVALAAWGVLLVTRGVVRRLIAILAALAAAAPVPAVWSTRHHLLTTHDGSHGTVWPWVALVALALSLVCAVVAVLKCPRWPEMGAKYDAPTGARAPVTSAARLEEQSSIDLWKSLDEGADPTRDPD